MATKKQVEKLIKDGGEEVAKKVLTKYGFGLWQEGKPWVDENMRLTPQGKHTADAMLTPKADPPKEKPKAQIDPAPVDDPANVLQVPMTAEGFQQVPEGYNPEVEAQKEAVRAVLAKPVSEEVQIAEAMQATRDPDIIEANAPINEDAEDAGNGEVRMFKGKQYDLVTEYEDKPNALHRVGQERGNGYFARVIKSGKMWRVYRRRPDATELTTLGVIQ